MSNIPTVQTVEEYLEDISYGDDDGYTPSDFALEFINFIKMINGVEGEEHKSPVLHFKMLDQVRGKRANIVNMLFRGSAKTTLLGEYLFLYLAVYGEIPGFGKVHLALYVSDSIENGVKNMRKNLEYRWENSEFLRKYIPETRFTDVRWEFNNISGNRLVVKGYGAKCLNIKEKLYTDTGITTIGACKVGDRIYGPNGELTTITLKSPVFKDKPMYRLTLKDGRKIDITHDHINSVVIKKEDVNIETTELLKQKLYDSKQQKHFVYIRNTTPVAYSQKDFLIDPYTLGLLLGDGDMPYGGAVRIMGLRNDLAFYMDQIPHELGAYKDSIRKGTKLRRFGIKRIFNQLEVIGVRGCKGQQKHVPDEYLYGSINQRLALLRGLMDTDGTVCKQYGHSSFTNISKALIVAVTYLVRSLGGTVTAPSVYLNRVDNRKDLYKLHIKILINPFLLPRKAILWQPMKSDLVAIKSIKTIPLTSSQCIAVDNEDRQFLTTDFTRTHNTGVRGSKEMGKRPTLALLDDLVSDEDARSATVIASIEDTVYKAVNYALHPTQHKIIWSGTPFNSKDPLYKAVESGAWYVNLYPVCETFPCDRKDFRGAWEDRFTYDYVNNQYQTALKAGKLDTFNQELMLQIMSDEERLIQDHDIRWYKHKNVLNNKGMFNFYITTDFATSEKAAADFSVISVWAVNNNGDFLWVDGICKRQLMNTNIDDLFRLVQEYNPQQVGVEVSGQQHAFIVWLQSEMMRRNIYFSMASEHNSNKPGIRPNTNKMERFNIVVPWFKLGRIFFPEEQKNGAAVAEAMAELRLASANGFRSKHDDFIDTISMLASMTVWKPSEVSPEPDGEEFDLWNDSVEEQATVLDSYIV